MLQSFGRTSDTWKMNLNNVSTWLNEAATKRRMRMQIKMLESRMNVKFKFKTRKDNFNRIIKPNPVGSEAKKWLVDSSRKMMHLHAIRICNYCAVRVGAAIRSISVDGPNCVHCETTKRFVDWPWLFAARNRRWQSINLDGERALKRKARPLHQVRWIGRKECKFEREPVTSRKKKQSGLTVVTKPLHTC